jgi:hypothetical protein
MRYKTLRVISLWTLSIVTFIVLVLFAAQQFLGPEVKKLFITEINKSLASEVQLDDVQLSLLKDFPYASVRFTGVRIKEALKTPTKNNLLTARVISLRFNILDLLRKKYRVKIVRLENVEAGPYLFADGSDNFHFWKQSSGTSNEDFHFELQRIIIQNLHLRYIDDVSHTFLNLHLPAFVAKGNFSNSQYALNLAGDVLIDEFKSRGANYIQNRKLQLALSMDANNITGLYNISRGEVQTGKLKLAASGNIVYTEIQKKLNLSVSASGSTFEEMLSLMPEKYTKDFADYKFAGNGNVSSTVSGIFGNGHSPAIQIKVSMHDGQITERKSGVGLRNVTASAEYSVKQDGENEALSISNLKANLGKGYVSGSLTMLGFSSPVIKCNLDVNLDLNELQQFLKYEYFTSMTGKLQLNAGFDGSISNIEHPVAADFLHSNVTGNGSIQGANLGLKNYDLPITGIQSRFAFSGNGLQLLQLNFQAGRSDFDLRGTLENLLPWIFVKGEKLLVMGSLSSQRFDWDQLSDAQQGSSGEYQFRLPGNINVSDLKIKCADFTFGKFKAAGITGMAQLRDKILSVADIAMLTCQGRVTGQVNINARGSTYSLLQAKARLEKVNVKMLFTEFANFGQDDLVDKNLEGLVSSDVIFASTMKNNLDIDLNSIKTHADIMIENGRLVNYSPMQSLSTYLRVEDLTDIRFSTLHNQIDIANQVIYIPAMEIKSSALDLQLMGTHTFDNDLDYHFTIALADLVASKFKKRNKGYDNQAEFGPVEDDGRGRTKIYVSLTGTVDNPIVKYDKKAMREKIAGDMKAQKVELKQAFQKEFNRSTSDTLRKAQQTKEKDLLKKQEQGKFVIEWDDDKK